MIRFGVQALKASFKRIASFIFSYLAAPQDKPENIQVKNISVDWEKQTRRVNLTWDVSHVLSLDKR